MSTKRDHDHLTGPNNPAAPTKRVRASSPRYAPAPTLQSPPPSPLPVDLQLEIFARSDNVTTVVRCAATSKPLRRAILEPAFKSRLLARLAEPNNGDLLAAVSFRIHKHGGGGGGGKDRTVARTSPHLRFDYGLLKSFKPASSRDGLLVLWRNHFPEEEDSSSYFRNSRCRVEVEICVCNTFTGHVTSLPRTGLRLGRDDGIRSLYRPALLTAADGSFELLVMDHGLQIQTFSARDGDGAVRQAQWHRDSWQIRRESLTAPVVIGRAIYRLFHLRGGMSSSDHDDKIIVLAMDADTGEADSIELPGRFPLWRKRSVVIGRLLCPIEELVVLGATTDDDGTKLSAVLVEDDRVSVWTLSQRRVWSQQVCIRRAAIEEQLAGGAEEALRSIRFEGFWGRSRTVLCRMAGVGLVRLDLETKKATVLCRCGELLPTDTCWA
nr:unnamed protein product [Digitaria exilis]